MPKRGGKRSLKIEPLAGPSAAKGEPDRRRKTSIPNLVITSLEVTQKDLDNHFFVSVTFAEINNVPESAMGYGAVGRQTVEELAGLVSLKLWQEECIFSPETQVVLLHKNGLPLPPSSTLAEALKVSEFTCGGDGVELQLNCVVAAYWMGNYFSDA